jgi:hypothetical protein
MASVIGSAGLASGGVGSSRSAGAGSRSTGARSIGSRSRGIRPGSSGTTRSRSSTRTTPSVCFATSTARCRARSDSTSPVSVTMPLDVVTSISRPRTSRSVKYWARIFVVIQALLTRSPTPGSSRSRSGSAGRASGAAGSRSPVVAAGAAPATVSWSRTSRTPSISRARRIACCRS